MHYSSEERYKIINIYLKQIICAPETNRRIFVCLHLSTCNVKYTSEMETKRARMIKKDTLEQNALWIVKMLFDNSTF